MRWLLGLLCAVLGAGLALYGADGASAATAKSVAFYGYDTPSAVVSVPAYAIDAAKTPLPTSSHHAHRNVER